MNLENELINEERKDYKCFNILRSLLGNESFVDIIKKGIAEGKISGFSDELWEKIGKQRYGMVSKTFEEDFKEGINLGACSSCAKQLSCSFAKELTLYAGEREILTYDGAEICGGVVPVLAGTKNCKDGSHTWMVADGYIYDTSLMLVIEENFAKELGYVEENRVDISFVPYYDEMYRRVNGEVSAEMVRK